MTAPIKQYDLTALCLWREARGEGYDGMHAVANVIVNRANKYKTSCDVQVMRPMQFSSMTAPGDPQLHLYPNGGDGMWQQAQVLARAAKASSLVDVTKGSTMYYSPVSLDAKSCGPIPILVNGKERPFPRGWDMSKVKFQVEILRHLFFTELA